MTTRFIVDDQSEEIVYQCSVDNQQVSGTYYNDTWTTITSAECRNGWFQYTFNGVGIEVAASSSTMQNYSVKLDNEPWISQYGRGPYKSPLLSDGQHTISYATGALKLPVFDYVVVDAGASTSLEQRIIVVDDADPSVEYDGAWIVGISPPVAQDFSSSAFENTIHWSTNVGDTMLVQFTGTSATIFGAFTNISPGHNFSATYSLDNISTTTRTLPKDTLDGLPMAILFSINVTAGNHTLLMNVTQIESPLAVGFDFFAYNASFVNISSYPGYIPPLAPSRSVNGKTLAGAIAGGVIGGAVCIGCILWWLRKSRRLPKQKDKNLERWSELKRPSSN